MMNQCGKVADIYQSTQQRGSAASKRANPSLMLFDLIRCSMISVSTDQTAIQIANALHPSSNSNKAFSAFSAVAWSMASKRLDLPFAAIAQ